MCHLQRLCRGVSRNYKHGLSVIKSGVITVHVRVQTRVLPDAGVNLRPSVDLDRGAWLLARPSNGRAKD